MDKALERSRQQEQARATWQPRLESARGDDAALLQVALGTSLLEIKLAAVEAIASEETLKQAEREFRSHDRRVHQLAKQRLQASVAQRAARSRAQSLIDAAEALARDEHRAVNRLAELDREWQALDARLLAPDQPETFAALRARLDDLVREAAQHRQQAQRWATEAAQTLAALRSGCRQLCTEPVDLEPLRASAESLIATASADAGDTAAQLRTLRALSDAVQARANWLSAPPEGADGSSWNALPTVDDAEFARLLEQRFERWQQAHRVPAPPQPQPDNLAAEASAEEPATAAAGEATDGAPPAEPAPSSDAAVPAADGAAAERAAPRSEPRPPSKAPSAEQLRAVEALLDQGEQALAEGHLAELAQHLQALDAAIDTMDGPLPGGRLRARRQALQAEHARLKGWQSWGGGRARDALVDEAEALARATAAAADPEARAPKLNLKAHADAIQSLRKRWKELDRLGAAASQPLWQRFDAALKTAYEPVGAQAAASKAAREENLAARQALLGTLEALPPVPESAPPEQMAAFWKERIRALDQFRTAWRQLGPMEHTVPAGARQALQARLDAANAHADAPLQAARRAAEAERETLIAAAEAMCQEMAQTGSARDIVPRTRELQAQWQHQARQLPLARAVEGALWARFRAATDKLFKAREELFSAREAEAASSVQAREAIIVQLESSDSAAPNSEIQQRLADADRAWRAAPEVPRQALAALENRYRQARSAMQQVLQERAHQRWQAQFDTLAARLALCREREDGADAAALAERWAALGELPPAWQRPLAQRWAAPVAAGPLSAEALDETLLQLEASLEMPADEASQAARRELKLRTMKETLEGRLSPKAESARRAEWLAAVLRQAGTSEAQQRRLAAILEHLRRAPPQPAGDAR